MSNISGGAVADIGGGSGKVGGTVSVGEVVLALERCIDRV